MSEWYWLVDDKVVPAPPGKYLQPIEDRKIGYDEIGNPEPYVSTVFIGLDHGYNSPEPVVFETMIFWSGSVLDNDGERYTTIEDARAGHARAVERVKLVRSASFAGLEVDA